MSIQSFEDYQKEKNQEVLKVAAERGYMEVIEAVGNNLVIRRGKKEDKTASGIITKVGSSTHDTPCTEGLVIAVGEEVKRIKRGDHVAFGQFAGSNTLELNGDTYIILKEEEIVGRVTRKPVEANAAGSVA